MYSVDDSDFEYAFAPDSLLPSSAETEEAILGGLIFDPGAVARIAPLLGAPEAFYIGSHQEIYRACLALHSTGKTTDLISVANWLKDQGRLEKAGGVSALVRLLDACVSAANIENHAELIAEKWKRRRLIDAAAKIQAAAKNTTKSIEEILEVSEQAVYEITNGSRSDDINQVESVGDILPRLWERLHGGAKAGIPSGFLDLDNHTGGFFPGTLTIFAGRPAMGKSQAGVALAYEVASRGEPVVFFTCEMSKEEVTNRLLARIAMIDSDRLHKGEIDEAEKDSLIDAIATLSSLPIHIHSASAPSPSEMRSVLRSVAAEHGGRLGIVILDYLQLLGGGGDNRVNELDKVVREFRAMAKEFQVPCLGIAQINRGVESRTNKRPMLSDIRESGAIENHADVVITLYRDEYYNADSPDRGIIEMCVAKNRHGRVGTVKMLFSPQYSLFRNIAR